MLRIDRVLLIDDDRFQHLAIRRVLAKCPGVGAIHDFSMGQEALDYLDTDPPGPGDLIFLDVNMPAMSGFEFLQAAEDRFGADLRGAVVILLSSSRNPSDRDAAKQFTSVRAFESKPLTAEIVDQARAAMVSP